MERSKKLKAKLVEKGLNYKHCASVLGISENTFSVKINNVDKFSLAEASKLAKELNFTNEERIHIFFGN